MKICDDLMAETSNLPPMRNVIYQYVLAGNGLFIRAEDSRMSALVPIAPAHLNGLAELIPFAELKVDRVPGVWLRSVLASARKHLPAEVLFQFGYDREAHSWRCWKPEQGVNFVSIEYTETGLAAIDLHSHNSMAAFFSSTDDADEQGLRFYAVIGRIDTEHPEIRVRAGVYGHFLDVPADMIFDDLGPFVDRLGEDIADELTDDLVRIDERESIPFGV